MTGVPWRRVVASLAIVAVLVLGLVVAFRADGYSAVDATVPRATRWFVHQATGRVVLADGYSGRALARLETSTAGDVIEVAQGAGGVALLDRSSAVARTIDASALRLGPPQSVSLLAEPSTIVDVGHNGLLAVDPVSSQAVLVPPEGDPVPFEVVAGAGPATKLAPDGSVWSIADDTLTRTTTTSQVVMVSGVADADFTLVGAAALVVDTSRSRVRFSEGDWLPLPQGVPVSEIVVQESGPSADCGWIGGNDLLWCVGETGIVDQSTIPGLDIDGADRLAIAGDAAALVRRSPAGIVRIDLRNGRVLDDVVASVTSGNELDVSVVVDLIWVDEVDGGLVWAVHPWGVNVIRKNDDSTPLLGESGEVLESGHSGSASANSGSDQPLGPVERDPDQNGIDDPPVAVDDPVTARTGASVLVAVTANDYDPDGEAIVVVGVGAASHGSVEIANASTVVYRPTADYIGPDRFDYTIVDGNGTPAVATVIVELLAVDATNQAPIGTPDRAETGPDATVVIDVLLNDVDPERDALRIASFTPSDVGGRISEVVAPSGLPGLRFVPPPGASGTASFTYRPVDSLGAIGEPVIAQIEIAQPSDENRPPITQPDGVRVRHDIAAIVPVLANDRDPDGDRLQLRVVIPVPPGLEVRSRGTQLEVIARAGVADLTPLSYTVDDGRGHVVVGNVLVALIADVEPNRPPIAVADSATAVVGVSQLIDVLVNDSDPDGDPVILVSVSSDSDSTTGRVRVQGNRIEYTAASIATDDGVGVDRFTYVISDGNRHEVTGEVSVRVLTEPIGAPPFAQDDSATTEVDVRVTLDVLRNDGDPSGERPTLVGEPGCAGGGSAAVTPDNRVIYTPPPGLAGVFRCTYEVTNSQGRRATAAIFVNVVEPDIANLAPIVVDEEMSVLVGGVLVVNLLQNDSDPDGRPSDLRVLSSTAPSLGTADRDAETLTFDAGLTSGIVTITYQVGDPLGGVTTGRLVIRISEPEPQPPTALDDLRTIVGPGTTTTIDVLANDADPDGINTSLSLVSAETVTRIGTITTGRRTITFFPDPDFVGDLVATYVVQDTDGLIDEGTVTLRVLEPLNRAPIAGDDAGDVVNGGTVVVPIALNDEDPDGDPLEYSIVDPADPELGDARLQNGSLVFDAVPGASGVARLTYRVNDGELVADASVRITVLSCAAAPPQAPDLFFQTGYQQSIAIDLTTAAVNGEIVSVGAPLSQATGVYTPPAGENGNVSFNYVVRNSCRIQDVGQVVIDVNQDPIGSPYLAQIGRIDPITIPVSSLASDAEPLVIAALEAAPGWITIVDQQRGLLIEPSGQSGRVDLIAVVVDTGGLQARVPVTIELVNRAPVANADEGVSLNGEPILLEPLLNDNDPDMDIVSLASLPDTVTFPNGVTISIQREGRDRLRIEPAGASGVATFAYTVVDPEGLVSEPAIVTLRVNSVPVAPDVTIVIPSDSVLDVVIPATDADGSELVLTIQGDPSPITIAVVDLILTLTAPPDVDGTVVNLSYTVTDESGATATGNLNITIDSTTTTTTTTTTPPTTTPPTTTPPTTTGPPIPG